MRSPLFGGRRATLAAGIVLALTAAASAQVALPPATKELQTVVSAQTVLDEFGGLQIESIPPAMLSTAQGIAIFPNMIKGGFILGVNYGQGVLMVRRNDGSWSPPAIVTMGGGSLGRRRRRAALELRQPSDAARRGIHDWITTATCVRPG